METNNENVGRQSYKFYSWDAMPELRADGRIPMGVHDLFEKEVEIANRYFSDPENEKNKQEFREWNRNCYSGDGIAQTVKKDRIYGKIDKNSKRLWEITPDAKLVDGALPITEEYYNSIDAEEIDLNEYNHDSVEGFLYNGVISFLIQKKALKNPFLEELLGEDLIKRVLDSYVKEHNYHEIDYGYSPRLDCNLYPYPSEKISTPVLRPFIVTRERSSLLGGSIYPDGNYFFVGVLDKEIDGGD